MTPWDIPGWLSNKPTCNTATGSNMKKPTPWCLSVWDIPTTATDNRNSNKQASPVTTVNTDEQNSKWIAVVLMIWSYLDKLLFLIRDVSDNNIHLTQCNCANDYNTHLTRTASSESINLLILQQTINSYHFLVLHNSRNTRKSSNAIMEFLDVRNTKPWHQSKANNCDQQEYKEENLNLLSLNYKNK